METKNQPTIDITEIMDSSISNSFKIDTSLNLSLGSLKIDKSQSDIDTSTLDSTKDPELSNSKSESKKTKEGTFDSKEPIKKTNAGLTDISLPSEYKIWLSSFFHIFFKLCNIVSYLLLG